MRTWFVVALLLMTLLSSCQGTERTQCSTSDIMLSQSQGQPRQGIPTYIVEIVNKSPSGTSISDIHVKCGMFSSAILIDPNLFKRLKEDDCLVNGGKPLPVGHAVSFTYGTTFQYPLSVSSVHC